MRYLFGIGIAASLVSQVFVAADSTATKPVQQSQYAQSTQLQPSPDQHEASSPSAGGRAITGNLFRACSEKIRQPCAVAPRIVSSPPPKFSEQARKARRQGICTIRLLVDAKGEPTDIRVIEGLGMGLDEEAVEAVKNWKFEPGTISGRPVAVQVDVEVDFYLPAPRSSP
jgi:TonB family protein